MSLIKQAEELEFVPKQQLIQMAQNPRGDYPPFLVISEIERRKQNERAFEAQQAKANMPTTTVAEESVMEFAGRGIAPSEPMLMASGGITGYDKGGDTKMSARKKLRENQQIERELARTLLEKRMTNMSSREIDQYADKVRRQKEGKELNPFRKLFEMQGFNEDGVYLGRLPTQDENFGDIYNRVLGGELRHGGREKYLKQLDDKIKNLRNELKLNEMGMASGGITQMQTGGALGTGSDSLAASFSPFMQKPEEDEDGIFRKAIDFAKENPAQALNYASNALLFVPGVGLLGMGAIKAGAKLLPRVVQAAKSAGQKGFTKPNPAFVQGPKGTGSFTMGGPERTFSLARTATVGLPAIGATKLGVEALTDMETETGTDKGSTIKRGTGEDGIVGVGTGRGIITDTTDTDDRDRALTLAQLGGVIGAARNPSELSAGIGQLAGNIQQQRRGEDMRQAELQLKQAQIAQVQSAIENLPIEQLNETYNAIIEGINAGQLDAEEYGPTLNAIVQRLMALQNIDLQDNTSILQETRVS
jgi:hypothetical protein